MCLREDEKDECNSNIAHLREEVWNLSTGKQVVDINQHTFIYHLAVREEEQETFAFQASTLVHFLNVLLEVV